MPAKHGLREKRTAAVARAEGWTVSAAADLAGVNRSTVWRWESGGDSDYCDVLNHCKRALLQDAADLASLAARELVRRLAEEPIVVSNSELNRIWGTAADKLLSAGSSEASSSGSEGLTRDQLLELLARELTPADLKEIGELQSATS